MGWQTNRQALKMRDNGEVEWDMERSDAVKQQLLSITSASSRVISKQTDWNRPTEARPGGEWGMDRRRRESTRVGAKHAKKRPWNVYNYHNLWKQNKWAEWRWMGRSAVWFCRENTTRINPCLFLISFHPPPSHPHPRHPSSISLFAKRPTEQEMPVRVKLKELQGSGCAPSVYVRWMNAPLVPFPTISYVLPGHKSQ